MNRLYAVIFAACFVLLPAPKTWGQGRKPIQIPAETIQDKIRGGLLGQMLGNLNGLPYEFKYIQEAGDLKNYVPSLPNGAFTDDDTDFEWVYIYTMQKKRTVMLPYADVNALWKERINRSIWSSNRYARYLMDIDMKPPMTGLMTLNPWADFNVSGQFLCETFGLLAPERFSNVDWRRSGLRKASSKISMRPASKSARCSRCTWLGCNTKNWPGSTVWSTKSIS
jgi:hypothetical protein